jgi:SAM-dependent methyltransferase
MSQAGQGNREPAEIDTSVAHASRVYDYFLGGTTNFEVDRGAAGFLADAIGGLDVACAHVRGNRAFLVRAVRRLVGEGIRQFLDIGTGVPNDTNTLAVAQGAAPEARVVCVDNDPVVLAHAHQLVQSTPQGAAAFVDADLRDPQRILDRAAETLDFTQPVGLVLVSMVHALGDHPDRYGLVSRLVDALAPGSYLVMSHLASDITPAETEEAIRRLNERAAEVYVLASAEEFARYFDGLELIEPGITRADQWDQDEPDGSSIVVPFHAAVARKP